MLNWPGPLELSNNKMAPHNFAGTKSTRVNKSIYSILNCWPRMLSYCQSLLFLLQSNRTHEKITVSNLVWEQQGTNWWDLSLQHQSRRRNLLMIGPQWLKQWIKEDPWGSETFSDYSREALSWPGESRTDTPTPPMPLTVSSQPLRTSTPEKSTLIWALQHQM